MTGLDASRRRLILATCCISVFMVGLDNTIVNVALPSIQDDLGASVSQLQWTIDAYTLVIASLLLFSGSMADRLGRKRVFKTGLVVFSVGSLLCSLAPTVNVLIAARTVQAVGGSMLNPVAMSIIRNTFDDHRERARAIGMWAGTVGVSLALGPVLGGLLVETVGWPAIFVVNVPVGIVAFVLTVRLIPESRAGRGRRIDPVGQFLVMFMLATGTFGIIEGPDAGWTSTEILGCFAASAACLVGLLLYEPRRRDPLIDLRFFRSAPFSGATASAVCAFCAFGGFLFLNTLYLQTVRHLSPLDAGLMTLPMATMAAVFGPISGRLVARRGTRPALMAGGGAMSLGSLMLVELTATTSLVWIGLSYVVFGFGFGMVNTPITATAVSGMPAEQAGVASALASSSRQVGQSLGVALVGALAVPIGGLTVSDVGDTHLGWWMIATFGAAVLALGAFTTGRWAKATARRLRSELSAGGAVA